MSKIKTKVAKLEKKAYVLKLPYGQYKKGEKIMLTKEGRSYLKSIHKI